MPPELVFEIDGRRVTHALVKDDVIVGRSGDSDVVIKNAMVSRRHARLHRDPDGWHVTDLGSSNGTRVNGAHPAGHVLRHGDRIQLHQFEIVFADHESPSFSVVMAEDAGGEVLHAGTVIRSAVDFSALASRERTVERAAPGADRLERLLTIVTRASAALLRSRSLDETLAAVLDLAFEHLEVDRGCIILRDEAGAFDVRAVRRRGGGDGPIRFSRTIAERVCQDRVAILTQDALHDDRFAGGQSIVDLGIRSAMAAPLWAGDRVEGLVYADGPVQARALDQFDLDVLSALGNHAAVAIEQSRLQRSILEEQIARHRLERYHSPAVVEHIISRAGADALAADEHEVTVLFADVVDFTTRCETLAPHRVAELLNRYLSEMAECVLRHEGTLDKFIGDCLMAVFGAPVASPDHAARAVRTALDMRETLEALNAPLPGDSRLEFRIGMHSGRVVAGDIGSTRRSDYTVLGATVNLAARLEAAVARPGQIVISEETRRLAGVGWNTREIGEVKPKGFSRPVRCFELLGEGSGPTP